MGHAREEEEEKKKACVKSQAWDLAIPAGFQVMLRADHRLPTATVLSSIHVRAKLLKFFNGLGLSLGLGLACSSQVLQASTLVAAAFITGSLGAVSSEVAHCEGNKLG